MRLVLLLIGAFDQQLIYDCVAYLYNTWYIGREPFILGHPAPRWWRGSPVTEGTTYLPI